MAAAARVVQLEDELRALRGARVATPSRWRRRWLLGSGLALLGLLGAAYWASKPASHTVMPSNAGTLLSVTFRANVDHVRFETEDGKTRIPTLPYTAVDADGAPVATRGASVLLTESQIARDEPTRIRVLYDFFGIPRSSLISFDAQRESRRFMQHTLDGLPQWVAFRDYDGRTLLYFTTMLVYKPSLREIRWGLDDGPLDRTVRFTPSDSFARGIDTEGDEIYTQIPAATRKVRVQVTYQDGAQSDVRTILRSDSELR